MMYARAIGATLLICCQLSLASGQLLAQPKAEEERVDVIVSHPESAGQPRSRVRVFFSRIKMRIINVTTRLLPMTRCEKWSVAKKDLDKVTKEAAKHGVVVTQLGPDRDRLMSATDKSQLDDMQKAMVERAKASKATTSVKIMRAPPPAVMEHALTTDIKRADGTSEPAKITVAFADNTTFTIVRTSVDIKPDMCIWRGTVEGSEAQVTLMWWASGKMTGTVQGRGRPLVDPPSRRRALRGCGDGRGSDAAGACAEGPALPSSDPTLRDDPLVQQGDASTFKPKATPREPSPSR